MNIIFRHIRLNIPIYFLLLLFGFLFFYRLDYNTLVSWDEAWYAAIAREIVRSGEFMKMSWNGVPFYDHPPMGFWIMALSYSLFGTNEFTTRLPSAFLGLLSIMLVYLTAKLVSGKRSVGFAAALILGTSVWYVIRVRSGNLDSAFVFFYIFTVYLAFRSSGNFKWFPLCVTAFASLCMTKTLIGVSALPLIVFLNIHHLRKFKKNWIGILASAVIFIVIVIPWYFVQYKTYVNFLQYHFLTIGARNKTFASYFNLGLEKPFFYLHMGMRKWYYLWLLSSGVLAVVIVRDVVRFFRTKKLTRDTFFILSIFIWNVLILYPFLTSEKTELWHLIPVYVPIAIIIAVGMFTLFQVGVKVLSKTMKYLWIPAFTRGDDRHLWIFPDYMRRRGNEVLYVVIIIFIAILQIKVFYAEVIPANKYVPDDVAICKKVSKYEKAIYLDDDFAPICTYYSDRIVYSVAFGESQEINTLVKLFESDKKDFVVITRSWAVDNLKAAKIPYKVLDKNNSFTIVTRN